MQQFRKKQRRTKRIRNAAVMITAAAFIVYITVEPTLTSQFRILSLFQLMLFVMVAASLALLFYYESKYGKAERYADEQEAVINDAGYYRTAREEQNVTDYAAAVKDDLYQNGFRIKDNAEYDGLMFDFSAVRGNTFICLVQSESVDKNDVIAYTDAALNDYTARLMKRRGFGIAVLLCETADESALSVSKQHTLLQTGRRSAISVFPVIVEVTSGRVFCLGNSVSPVQKLIFNYVMNCALPLKERYICRDKLPFQSELEEKLQHFDGKQVN